MNRRFNIPFNRPFVGANEEKYLHEVLQSRLLAGNNRFTRRVQKEFEKKFSFKKTLLTTSATDALEMSAILSDIQPGDEVIVPAYTFVSTALAFVRQGAKIVFIDSMDDHPNMDVSLLPSLITSKTKAIVVVHYAGISVEMDFVNSIAKEHNIKVIEDAAQAVDSYYKGQPLGGLGDFGVFSFHETKNIHCGEGGLLIVNDEKYFERSEIIWEKGTNRSQFYRGMVNKYEWQDIGSSFLPDELNAAFLLGQIENLEYIQERRKKIWNAYYEELKYWAKKHNVILPYIPDFATNNAHMFYLIFPNANNRDLILKTLQEKGILAVFHYLALNRSPYILKNQSYVAMPNAEKFSDTLIRLPLFVDLTDEELMYIIESIKSFTF